MGPGGRQRKGQRSLAAGNDARSALLLRRACRQPARHTRMDPTGCAGQLPPRRRWCGRGLAQVMPDVGERLAKELKYPVWDPVLLYQPDVSIQLGAFHLHELVGRYDQRARILAAYNAGSPRVERWSKRIGVDDPEVFAEQISFVETRDYVRVIQRNEDIYRTLYGEITG